MNMKQEWQKELRGIARMQTLVRRRSSLARKATARAVLAEHKAHARIQKGLNRAFARLGRRAAILAGRLAS